MKINLSIYFVFVFCLFSVIVKAESKFHTKITFPLSVNLENVTIEYHNGYHQLPFELNLKSHTQEISEVYYSKYPVLIVSYNYGDDILYPNRYYLEKNSSITYKKTSKEGLGEVDIKGAYAFKDMGEAQFNLFAKDELGNLKTFLSVNRQYINDSTAIFDKFIQLEDYVQKKKLLFIQSNSQLYYSLWLFKEEFASNRTYTTDSLLNVYNQFLSQKFSGTWEGKLIVSILNGRLSTFKGKTAPLFLSQDVKGNVVDLAKFKKEKYVILNFWASWCKPCLEEMPILDSIYQLYTNKNIAIISVSEDRIKEKSLKNIEKFKMNWINIINEPIVNSAYGNPPSLPQVYLINKEGEIIYSRTEDKDYDLKKLYKLVGAL